MKHEGLRVYVLDGASTIGGTKILLVLEDEALILDFGFNFHKYGLFFEELLSPRERMGISEFLAMELLPNFEDLYRQDLRANHPIQPKGSLRDIGVSEVAGVFLSHPHRDHFALAGFLRKGIPAIATAECAMVMEACQKAYRGVGLEVIHTRMREKTEEGVLQTSRNEPPSLRPLLLFSEVGPEECKRSVTEFLGEEEAEVGRKCWFKGLGEWAEVGPFEVTLFEVDHSAPGSAAIAVRTGEGLVVYTGDFRMHGARAERTREFIERLEGEEVLALIIEGTRVDERRKKGPRSEEELKKEICSILRRAEGRAVVAMPPSRHPERLCSFLFAASESGRRLVLTSKEMYVMLAASAFDSVAEKVASKALLLKDRKARYERWERELIEWAGERLIEPSQIREEPGEYVVCLDFWRLNMLLEMADSIEGGVFIYSTSEPHNEEQECDMERVRNWVRKMRMEMVGDPEEGTRLHVSGHATRGAIKELVKALRPKYLIPVHTTAPQRFKKVARKAGAKLLLPSGPYEPIPLGGRA